MQDQTQYFSSIWIAVSAIKAKRGEVVTPVSFAVSDLAGHHFEIGVPKLRGVRFPPYPTGPQSLVITIDATELFGMHLALGWRLPERVVDLLVEFRNLTNGKLRPAVGGLAGALLWFGCSTTGALHTGTSGHQLRQRLEAVTRLFHAMRSTLNLGHALLRGRYLAAVARIEIVGLPIDQRLVEQLRREWGPIKQQATRIIDAKFGVYPNGRFDATAFELWLQGRNIVWPVLPSGQLNLSDDAFREMARVHPEIRPLKELRTTLTVFDPNALTLGRDGRNRTPLRPFSSSTGRNQPGAKASLLGTAAWTRHLIKPDLGTGLAVIDWRHQEFGIAAALSGDVNMMAAYRSGDPYLALAVAAGAAPASSTKWSHPHVRERFKTTALGLLNGMGAARLACQIGCREADARELIAAHKAQFSAFWRWSDGVENHALLRRELNSVFGWRTSVHGDANPRSLRNFPMQANGAEMLRWASCLVAEAEIKVCAVLHDALVIEAPLIKLDSMVAVARGHMTEASAVVLDGFELETEATLIRAPDRWADPRGRAVWSAVESALTETGRPARERNAPCSAANPRPILLSVLKEVEPNASH